MSTFMGWTEVIVRTSDSMLPPPLVEPIVAGHQKDLKTGFMGLGAKQKATFTAELNKDTYAFGETCTVRVFSDNTACAKEMEPVKVMLECSIDVTATETGFGAWTKTKKIGPLKVNKAIGQRVPAKEKFQQEITFTIPTLLEKGYCPWGYYMPNKQGEVSPYQRGMLQ